MWKGLGKFVLANRLWLLVTVFLSTILMGYFASKVKLSYEFSKAIPTDNPRYLEYQSFKKTFGDDGNLLVLGIQSDELFNLAKFQAYQQLHTSLKAVKNVEDVLSVPAAVTLVKDSVTEKLTAVKIFPEVISTQPELDTAKAIFDNLPFYHSLLYNPETHAYLVGMRINKQVLNSAGRTQVVADISAVAEKFRQQTGIQVHLSGLPLIRTVIGDRVQKEMKLFLFGSLALSVLILLLFFRSLSTTLISLSVVIISVIFTIGIIYLCGYKITLLTALIPSLVVVIGIPNCIYFINKYHSSYLQYADKAPEERKMHALIEMVSKMGIVTLFCNLTAAIGFAVFALTKSAILKEFGVVAGISIMLIFVLSFILLPAVLSYLRPPGEAALKYLHNKWITRFLVKVETWSFGHKRAVLLVTFVIVLFSLAGIARLKSVGYIVDDLPKNDQIYTDLKFFEHHFKGVMPLEIVIDTRQPNGLRKRGVFERVDSLSTFIASMPETNRPLSISEGFKFFYQAFSEGDSSTYVFPNEKIVEELVRKLKPVKDSSGNSEPADALSKMLLTFMDSSRQRTRISISMADVGSSRLPEILDTIQKQSAVYFDSTKYHVTLTGTSITFLEGSRFIIKGLGESILWAFLLISLCMLYLFRSLRILICSLVPNIIPLLVTAGIMGWAGVPLKPSTVLIFSVALGIAVDITIRFLVNYKQDLAGFAGDVPATVSSTVKQTGLSIVYTSLVLTAGFIIFCASSFGGTFALGWLTSVTLFVATITNLVLLPVLLLILNRKKILR